MWLMGQAKHTDLQKVALRDESEGDRQTNSEVRGDVNPTIMMERLSDGYSATHTHTLSLGVISREVGGY